MGKAAFKELVLHLRQAEGAHSPFLTHGTVAYVLASPLLGKPWSCLLYGMPGG